MRYSIRRVDTSRLDVQGELYRLQKLCLPYDEFFSVHEGYWWLAFDPTGTAVAFAGLVRSIRWSDCGYLCRAGVLPAHRGKGLQKKLIGVRLAHARRLGWNWAITDTHENPASANSLIAAGFRLFDPSKPWGFKNSLYWRKKL